jgi:CBS domain-containing protein
MRGTAMKVLDIMTKNVKSCRPSTSVAEAATLMWDNDFGVLPVTDDDGKVIGVVTDRDICMSVITKNQLPSDIRVSETISGNLDACSPEDDIQTALKTMQNAKVRRLPVINRDGKLQGILSLNDVILRTVEAKGKGLSNEDVINTLKAICEHRTKSATA